MVLDPNYPESPYIWVLYSVNHVADLNVPDTTRIWDSNTECPANNYCGGAARFTRIRVNPATNVGTTDQILISDWCGASGSHHTGDLNWAPDGGLYLSTGDGASFTVEDLGIPSDVCHNSGDGRDQGVFRSQWDDYLLGKILYISQVGLDMTAMFQDILLTMQPHL